MAELDFHPPKVEQNVGKSTDNQNNNFQNEINTASGTLPNTSKSEIANQTEAMTKGDRPILPAFDMSRFGDEKQSKDSSSDASTNSSSSEGVKATNKNLDNKPKGSTGPSDRSESDAVTATNKNLDSNTKSSTGPKDCSDSDAVTATNKNLDSNSNGSSKVDFAPKTTTTMTGNATSAGSQTSARP